jgi:hypothetical protein
MMFILRLKSTHSSPITGRLKVAGRKAYEMVACDDGLDDPEAVCILVDGTPDNPGPNLIYQDGKFRITRFSRHMSNRSHHIDYTIVAVS